VVVLGKLLKLDLSISMPEETWCPVAGHTNTKVPMVASLASSDNAATSHRGNDKQAPPINPNQETRRAAQQSLSLTRVRIRTSIRNIAIPVLVGG
jgi:hypothetical protein